MASLAELAKDIEADKVETLLILGGNPAYTAPADLGIDQDAKKKQEDGPDGRTRFARLIRKVPLSIRLGLYIDETSEVCTWHIPEAHFLESWGDGRAFDGTASIVQPLISPLYNGKSAHEIFAVMMGQFDRSPLNVVQDYWKGQKGATPGFEAAWRKALHDGKVGRLRLAAEGRVSAKPIASFGTKPAAPATGYEIAFRPDPTIWDGRFANLGWLQELPKPITKLVWDNAALVSSGDGKSSASTSRTARTTVTSSS